MRPATGVSRFDAPTLVRGHIAVGENGLDQMYTVLVSSTDSYSDCWGPFFSLFEAFWPQPWPRVVLCTESQGFTPERLPLREVHVGTGRHPRPPWGTAVLSCLRCIPSDLVLYLQDDYFLKGLVRVDIIDQVARLMLSEHIDCVRLMECDGAGPWKPSSHELLWNVDQHAQYRVTLQAALWRRDALAAFLRAHESPWQFEVWGSRRVARRGGDIRCISRHLFNDEVGQVVPYVPTGIVKGRWNRDVVEALFEKHGISVDFSQRGFWRREETIARKRDPRKLLSRVRSLW